MRVKLAPSNRFPSSQVRQKQRKLLIVNLENIARFTA